MHNKYSEELIQKTIKYFAEKHNHYINEETAEEYLTSLSNLFRCFIKK